MTPKCLREVWAVNDAASHARLALSWSDYIFSLEYMLLLNLGSTDYDA